MNQPLTAFVVHKQPGQLQVLSKIDLLERLVYYLFFTGFMTFYYRDFLKFDVSKSSFFSGIGMFSAFFGPALLSGLSDWIGKRRSALIGLFTLSGAYFVFSLGTVASAYVGILLLSLGVGMFKGPMAALVGGLYTRGDPRRDSGFGVYYRNVNWGALVSPFITAAALAGSLAIFHSSGYLALFRFGGFTMLLAAAIMICSWKYLEVADHKSEVDVVCDNSNDQRSRHRLIAEAAIVVAIFWLAFHQNNVALPLWSESNIDLTMGRLFGNSTFLWGLITNGEVSPLIFGSINSLCIVLFTGVTSWIFNKAQLSTPGKLSLGMALTGLSFVVLAIPSLLYGDTMRVSWLWILVVYFIMTEGELCLSPIGLSMVTKLAAKRYVGVFLGVWYFGTAIGNFGAGAVGMWWDKIPHYQFWLGISVLCFMASVYVLCRLNAWKKTMPTDINAEQPLDYILPPNLESAKTSREMKVIAA